MNVITNIKNALTPSRPSVEDAEQEQGMCVAALTAAEADYITDPSTATGDRVHAYRRALELADLRLAAARTRAAEAARVAAAAAREVKLKQLREMIAELEKEQAVAGIKMNAPAFRNVGRSGALVSEIAELGMQLRAKLAEVADLASEHENLHSRAEALNADLAAGLTVPPALTLAGLRWVACWLQREKCIAQKRPLAQRADQLLEDWLEAGRV